MATLKALYVDDETGPETDRFQQVVSDAGFTVLRAHSAEEARAIIASPDARMLDLVVLDRKLPLTDGDQAEETVGDQLFRDADSALPDVAIVVLTGYSDEDSWRLALQRLNSLDVGDAELRQRVQHLRKSEALDFRESVNSLARSLQRTEDVELDGFDGEPLHRRLIKRVGQRLKGSVVRARCASGGLTGAKVWICDVYAGDGRWLTSVVVKVAAFGSLAPTGGFMATIPSQFVAAPHHNVSGACRGLAGHVAPLAAAGASSLMNLLKSDSGSAVGAASDVLTILEGIPSAQTTLPISECIAPLIGWGTAEAIAHGMDVHLPDPALPVLARVGCLHGDLHAGNVLLDQGRPVFIDFDAQCQGSLMIDVLTLGLGAVFHPDGPLRDSAITVDDVVSLVLGAKTSDATWLERCARSWSGRSFGEREKWAAVLGYSLRQCRYSDVTDDARLADLAVGLVKHAAARLRDS